jgi:hypothetical protein
MPSSAIRSFTYDRERAELDVIFVTGRCYRYFTVPDYVARGFAEAFSKGRYFNTRIRGRFPFEELESEPEAAGARVTSREKESRRRP